MGPVDPDNNPKSMNNRSGGRGGGNGAAASPQTQGRESDESVEAVADTVGETAAIGYVAVDEVGDPRDFGVRQ